MSKIVNFTYGGSATISWTADEDLVLVGVQGMPAVISCDPQLTFVQAVFPPANQVKEEFILFSPVAIQLNIPIDRGKTLFVAPTNQALPANVGAMVQLIFDTIGPRGLIDR